MEVAPTLTRLDVLRPEPRQDLVLVRHPERIEEWAHPGWQLVHHRRRHGAQRPEEVEEVPPPALQRLAPWLSCAALRIPGAPEPAGDPPPQPPHRATLAGEPELPPAEQPG